MCLRNRTTPNFGNGWSIPDGTLTKPMPSLNTTSLFSALWPQMNLSPWAK
ncbi:hypothetical protein FRUB_08393 [Fimbriiglobus ruber]|uniref:Uncharacterized protein n=1 Tax=Fimbriiglobus ruber TaxID=1908690 RepID=A0A225D2L5_9BACT|nr:hypothetical protein FRUB_08393 [Fimbriiglobus ruber]